VFGWKEVAILRRAIKVDGMISLKKKGSLFNNYILLKASTCVRTSLSGRQIYQKRGR